MDHYEHLVVDDHGALLRIWLNRPELRNAFNPQLVAELTDVFRGIHVGGPVRVVTLGGRGQFFCAGADLNWMAEMVNYTGEENYEDALRLAGMLETLDSCPAFVICHVQRGAFGGALGLMSCCDAVVCDMEATFAFSETRLGISPATIAPYVLSKIGLTHGRSLMLSGQRFDSAHAEHIGLVHRIAPLDYLEQTALAMADAALLASPAAVAKSKALLRDLGGAVSEGTRQKTAALIAELRASGDGQEGLKAFLSKRRPAWQEASGLGMATLPDNA